MCMCCGPNISDTYKHVVMFQTKHKKHTHVHTNTYPAYVINFTKTITVYRTL